MLKKQSLWAACLQASGPPPGHGGHPLHSESMLQPPHLQVPCTKVRALILPTLTHFSINGFLNTSHTRNKPLTMAPPPGPPKPSVTHLPPSPSPSFPGCSKCGSLPLQGEQAARNPGPGFPRHQLSSCTLIREPTRPPSLLAGDRQLSARDLAMAMEQGLATCWVLFPGPHHYPSHFMEELLQL